MLSFIDKYVIDDGGGVVNWYTNSIFVFALDFVISIIQLKFIIYSKRCVDVKEWRMKHWKL